MDPVEYDNYKEYKVNMTSQDIRKFAEKLEYYLQYGLITDMAFHANGDTNAIRSGAVITPADDRYPWNDLRYRGLIVDVDGNEELQNYLQYEIYPVNGSFYTATQFKLRIHHPIGEIKKLDETVLENILKPTMYDMPIPVEIPKREYALI